MDALEDYDVVIAGAGHNSLITGAYLARVGLRVVVLEKGPIIGGDTVSEELTVPGFLHDSCASAHVLIQNNPLLRNDELQLGRYGLEYLCPEKVAVMPFSDGRSLTMYLDRERTQREFAKFSPRDAKAYQEMLVEWGEVAPVLNKIRHSPPRSPNDFYEALEGHPRRDYWLRVRMSSSLEVVQDRFQDEHVKAFMVWMAMLTPQPADRPFTGLLAYSTIAGRQAFSWTTPKGGSIQLPRALARIIQENGGAIHVNSAVQRVLVDNGRAVGVQIEDGTTFTAKKAVVSTIHVKHLPQVVGEEHLSEAFLEGLSHWRPGMTMFVTHFALAEAPQYRLEEGPGTSVAMGTAESVDNILAQLSAFRRGRVYTERPLLLAVNSTLVDPSRAPAGKHTLKLISLQPYELPEGPQRWDEIKEEVAGAILNYLRRFAPNLTDDNILGRLVESPLDLERRNPANYRGSCHGGDVSPAQEGYMRPVPGWAQYRTPVAGLYQTGACTHPGGSVSGAPGRNAAQVILEDLGLSLEEVVRRAATA